MQLSDFHHFLLVHFKIAFSIFDLFFDKIFDVFFYSGVFFGFAHLVDQLVRKPQLSELFLFKYPVLRFE